MPTLARVREAHCDPLDRVGALKGAYATTIDERHSARPMRQNATEFLSFDARKKTFQVGRKFETSRGRDARGSSVFPHT